MPSPFPGMDPFLEAPDIFPDIHGSFNGYLREFLQSQLPTPYYARIERRAWIELSHRHIGPNVNVLHAGPKPRWLEDVRGSVAVAAATAVLPSGAVVIRAAHDEQRELFVNIYMGRGETKRLVTTIEILSLANKTPGQRGRDLYLRKQREIHESEVNLVEIDLLRAGKHTTAVPEELAVTHAGPFDYHVCVHQFDNVDDYVIYPVRLQDRLPAVAIPLLPGDPAVMVNLQAVFDRCYDTGAYDREIRYQEDRPVPPLRPDQEAWASTLINTVTDITPSV